MINRDPRCVFVADSLGQAEVVALWLNDQGLPADVMDPATLGGLDGLTWLSKTGVSARGIEVWVADAEHIDKARRAVEEHEAARAAQAALDASVTIELLCEECGEVNAFPGSARGKVENCIHCGGYIDVATEDDDVAAHPDGDEDEPDG